MAPQEDEVPTNPPANGGLTKKSEEPLDENLPWYQKYKETLIGIVIIVVFVIIISSVFAAGGGDDTDRASGPSPPLESAPSTAPLSDTTPTMPPSTEVLDRTGQTTAPTTFFDSLDKDKDGLAQFDCSVEPYFDNQGRLIFSGCDVS